MNSQTVRIVAVCLSFTLLASLAVMPATAQANEETFLVELDTEGNADVSVTFAYNLDSDDEQTAFKELRSNETAQSVVTERFENRMSAVAADTSAATDREMSVENANTELERDGSVGTVTLSVEWSNFAAVDGDKMIVTEPFASGFKPELPLTVTAPEGYEITQSTPEPTSTDGATVTWTANASLESFELVVEPAAETEGPDDDATEDTAGFGVVVAVTALVAATLLAVRGAK